MKRKRNYEFSYRMNKKRKKDVYDIKYTNDDSGSESESCAEYALDKLLGVYVKENHIWFNCDVNKSTANRLIRIIYEKNEHFEKLKNGLSGIGKLDPYPLILHINSYGGDLLEILPVVDIINKSDIPIYTIVEGCAASAATLMSVAGEKRYMTENSVMLIHQLRGGMWGKMDELEDEHKNCTMLMKQIKKIYKKHSNLTEKQLNEFLKHDVLWNSETCLKHGLIDEVSDFYF